MGKYIAPVDHPELTSWLAGRPRDEELSQHETTFRAADGTLQALRRRVVDYERRIVEVDRTLFDATGKQRQFLLTTRQTLAAELDAAPAEDRHLQRRRNLAALGWLARVRTLALAEMAATGPVIDATIDELRPLGKAVWEHDARVHHGPTMTDDERAANVATQERKIADLQPTRDRHNRAELVARVAEARALAYHADVDLSQPHRFEEWIDAGIRGFQLVPLHTRVHA